MPAPRETALKWKPRGVTDTIDGDNSDPGSMMALQNLMYDPSTPNIFLCRPANQKVVDFVAGGFSSPGIVSCMYELNNIVYGLIASSRNTGHDEPFAYNMLTSAFLTVGGITSANTPNTPASSGAWTPPSACSQGQRIIFTHPGFNITAGNYFGYFDVSGFTETTTGNITSGSTIITGNPVIAGVGPGYPISGTGIPANTTVKNTAAFSLTTTGNTNSNTSLTNVANTTGLAVGQLVTGVGIPTGTIITNIAGTTVTISNAATATASVSLFFTGATITLSANASASTNNLSVTISGGTLTAPQWCAGNLTGVTQLALLPQYCFTYNNRVYFANSNYLTFTDTLALNITNASGVQVLTVGDTRPITAMQGLPLYTTTGGVLAALVIFKQNTIWQLTGDIATSNLQINQLSGSIGTQAPRSVASSPYGIYFMAADGVRNITLAGAVSEPDNNIALPFINALYPSRVAGTYSADIYRLCVQNSIVAGTPFQDYYYHAKYDEWSGPHTFRVDHAIVYLNDFLVVNNSASASIWQSFSAQGRNSTGNTFIENGVQLTWSFISSPMTDLKNLYANCAVRTTLDIDQPATGDIFTFQAIDAFNGVLATAFIRMGTNLAIWGTFNWGASLWGAVQSGLSPITIPWSNPIIFDKLIFCASGNSSLTLRLGSIFVGYERLRYSKQ